MMPQLTTVKCNVNLLYVNVNPPVSLWGEYYRGVRDTPDGDDHSNIRAFMKEGWDGVKFDNGVALTKKVTGDGGWGWDEESFIP